MISSVALACMSSGTTSPGFQSPVLPCYARTKPPAPFACTSAGARAAGQRGSAGSQTGQKRAQLPKLGHQSLPKSSSGAGEREAETSQRLHLPWVGLEHPPRAQGTGQRQHKHITPAEAATTEPETKTTTPINKKSKKSLSDARSHGREKCLN